MENPTVKSQKLLNQSLENLVTDSSKDSSTHRTETENQEKHSENFQEVSTNMIKMTSAKDLNKNQEDRPKLRDESQKPEKIRGGRTNSKTRLDSEPLKTDNSTNALTKSEKKDNRNKEAIKLKTQAPSAVKQINAKSAQKQARASARTESSVQNITQSQDNIITPDKKSSRHFILDSIDELDRKSEMHTKNDTQGDNSTSTHYEQKKNSTKQSHENSNVETNHLSENERDENFHKKQLEEAIREKKALETKVKGLEIQIKEMNFNSIGQNKRAISKSVKNLSKKEDEDFLKKKAEEILKQKAEEILAQKVEALMKQMRDGDLRKQITETPKECTQEHYLLSEANTSPQDSTSNASQSKLLKQTKQNEDRPNRRFSSHDLRTIVPLYKQLEQANEEVQMKELENRKKILAERRELYKPFKNKELMEFETKYQNSKKTIESKRRIEQSEDSRFNGIEFKKYESKRLNQVLEYDQDVRTFEERKEQAKKMLSDKKLQYAKAIRDLFLPKLSKNRRFSEVQENVKVLIERAEATDHQISHSKKKPGRSFRLGREARNLIQIEGQSTGGEVQHLDEFIGQTARSKESRMERDCNSVEAMNTSKELTLPRSPDDASSKKKFKAFKIGGRIGRKVGYGQDWEASSIQKSYDERVDGSLTNKPYPNYISELKKKREDLDKKGVKYKKLWERNLRDDRLTYAEKVTYVLDNIKSVEEIAKEKEAWIRKAARVGSIDLKEEQDQVDDLYVDSIRAKIEVLAKFRRR